MARIWIKAETLLITKAGRDPRYATDRDDFLFHTDWVADQLVAAGLALFSGDTATVSLPPLHSTYKVDFFYWTPVDGGRYQWPDFGLQELDAYPGFTIATQLWAEFSGGNVVFSRRGQIAGVADRGVQYWLYASPSP